MRGAVRRPRAAARLPRVADETLHHVELAGLENLPLADGGPPHDHLEHAAVLRRAANLVEPRFELARRQMLHDTNCTHVFHGRARGAQSVLLTSFAVAGRR